LRSTPESTDLTGTGNKAEPPSGRRLGFSAVAGATVAALIAVCADWRYAPATGWDATALTFCGSVWLTVRRMSAPEAAAHATSDDPRRAARELLILGASVASLAAVGIVLLAAHSASPPASVLLAGLALVSVVVSWCTVHTVFMLRYAALYYGPPAGGIDFGPQEPDYRDFAYLAFTLGMTYQVSDTSLQDSSMRAAALLSYLFGSGILATVINLMASLGTAGAFG
jgi:uncharacterized membrane protein